MSSFFVDNDNNFWVDGLQLDANSTFINDATLTLSLGHEESTGEITGATNASPIVITSAAHGLTNGQTVVVSHVEGNRAANGTWVVANATTNTFELQGSTGTGTYTTGGDWYIGMTGGTSLSVAYVAASNGRYYAILPSTAQAIAGEKYRAIIFCSNYGIQLERIFTALIRG